MSTKENGIHFLDRGEYERLARVNFSTLKHIANSPLHYHQALLTPYSDTDAKKQGRACHLGVYEPEQFKAKCVVFEGPRRAGKDWEAFVDRHPDDEILTPHMHEVALAVGRAVRASKQAEPFISKGQGEVTVLWQYKAPPTVEGPGFAIDCKSRLDWIAEVNALADLKTVNRVGGASPTAFGWTCKNLKYFAQAAFYRRAYASVTGKLLPYHFIAAETQAPYAVQVYRATDEQLELGEQLIEEWMRKLHHCRTHNHWPSYAEEVLPLEMPMPWGDEDDSLVEELGLAPVIGFGTL